MESPLEVLSRAATMIQNNNLETKQLPTTKWRRDRRNKLPDYCKISNSNTNQNQNGLPKKIAGDNGNIVFTNEHNSSCEESMDSVEQSITPPCPPYPLNGIVVDSPIDMRILKNRTDTDLQLCEEASNGAIHLKGAVKNGVTAPNFRPSVITQAPSTSKHSSNATPVTESVSMCDPVIEEHFRRSLGSNYEKYLQSSSNNVNKNNNNNKQDLKKAPVTSSEKIKPIVTKLSDISITKQEANQDLEDKQTSPTDFFNDFTTGFSVDEHFAKALGGDTWTKLQEQSRSINNSVNVNNNHTTNDNMSICKS